MRAGKIHIPVYLHALTQQPPGLIYFGYSFRFFVSAVRQNNKWMSEFWVLHRGGLIKCGTYSHLFYATHKNTHTNNHRCFVFFLPHTSCNWKQCLYASAKMHHISRVASEVESLVVLVVSAGHATASSSTFINSHSECYWHVRCRLTHALFRNLNEVEI